MMRLLLLGDSIRMGYQPFVREGWADGAQVEGPADNCADSGHCLDHLERWLGEDRWSLIHFNCGLHDLKIDRQMGVCKTPLDRYRQNLRAICARLQQTGARLIWAATTPVIYERHVKKGFDRREEDVLAYNRAAAEVTGEFSIAVDDLHEAVIAGGVERLLSDDGVHYTEEGKRLLADTVVEVCRKRIATGGP